MSPPHDVRVSFSLGRLILQLAHAHQLQALPPADIRAAFRDLHLMFDEFAGQVLEMRTGAMLADEHNDPGTVDLTSRVVQIYESSGGCATANATVSADKAERVYCLRGQDTLIGFRRAPRRPVRAARPR